MNETARLRAAIIRPDPNDNQCAGWDILLKIASMLRDGTLVFRPKGVPGEPFDDEPSMSEWAGICETYANELRDAWIATAPPLPHESDLIAMSIKSADRAKVEVLNAIEDRVKKIDFYRDYIKGQVPADLDLRVRQHLALE
jgi:hypothetical protein